MLVINFFLCFFKIQLKFEEDLQISKIYSKYGDDIDMGVKVTANPDYLEGWLTELLNGTMETVRINIGKALADHKKVRSGDVTMVN